jgi:decaprenyl-phosphate phosphoribosyltransferase
LSRSPDKKPLAAIVRALRPRQWVKNLFVAAPLVFAKRLGDRDAMLLAGAAVAIFCALSSAVYLVNDLVDREKDRAHPTKRHRPIAAGHLAHGLAVALAAVLGLGALGGALAIDLRFGAVAGVYLTLNALYSFGVKEVAYVDVAIIATGFLLRVLAGAYAVDVPPSPWLLTCTALLAALLGFGKRAHELGQAQQAGRALAETRGVLARYSAQQLRIVLWILAAATTAAYVFYTQSPHTVAFFGTRQLLWTAPFCALGIARFLHLVTRHGEAESPTDAILRDLPFMANLGLWGTAVLIIIYAR